MIDFYPRGISNVHGIAARQGEYQFRPMSAADLPLIQRWLVQPRVVEWWGSADEQLALISGDLNEPAMAQFIVGAGGTPLGYIQSFDLKAWPDGAFHSQPDGTRAIDQFIGEPETVGRGHGSAFIRAFVDNLLANGAPRVITDPDPDNARAIRAYEKAGFERQHVIDTLDGPALLMVRNR
jgi:aminoglycoside 6'-N-acetyltransferase